MLIYQFQVFQKSTPPTLQQSAHLSLLDPIVCQKVGDGADLLAPLDLHTTDTCRRDFLSVVGVVIFSHTVF